MDPGRDRAGDLLVRSAASGAEVSRRLVESDVPIFDLLVAAAARTVTRWRQSRGQSAPPPLLALETHGRADAVVQGAGDDAIDTTDTVGLLSAIYPLRVQSTDPHRVRDQLAAIPGAGIDYGLLRYLRADTAQQLRRRPQPQLLLNYLGRTDVGDIGTGPRLDRELLAGLPLVPQPGLAVRHELTIMAALVGAADQYILLTQWRALPDVLSEAELSALQALWQQSLQETVP